MGAIENFHWVAPLLVRGARPLSHKDLQAKGVSIAINLESGFYEQFFQDDYETEIPREFGIVEKNLHLSNWEMPTVERLEDIVQEIEVERALGNVVFVHCRWGKDRTGIVLAAWRIIVQGWTYEAAVKEMFGIGFRRYVYFLWLRSLKQLAEKRGRA